MPMNRRAFGAAAAGLFASFAAGAACDVPGPLAAQSDGRLTTKPRGGTTTASPGISALGLDASRDAWLQLPAAPTNGPVPLVVMLHGAGGNAERFVKRFAQSADLGVALLVPNSRASTWDSIRGDLGP